MSDPREPDVPELPSEPGGTPGQDQYPGQQARWAVLSFSEGPEAVRAALEVALRSPGEKKGRLAIAGMVTRTGVVLRCEEERRVFGAEIIVSGEESGSRVHIAVPKTGKTSEPEIEEIKDWVYQAVRHQGRNG
jgi:hypothetical protein